MNKFLIIILIKFKDEMIGKNLFNFISPDDISKFMNLFSFEILNKIQTSDDLVQINKLINKFNPFQCQMVIRPSSFNKNKDEKSKLFLISNYFFIDKR